MLFLAWMSAFLSIRSRLFGGRPFFVEKTHQYCRLIALSPLKAWMNHLLVARVTISIILVFWASFLCRKLVQKVSVVGTFGRRMNDRVSPKARRSEPVQSSNESFIDIMSYSLILLVFWASFPYRKLIQKVSVGTFGHPMNDSHSPMTRCLEPVQSSNELFIDGCSW